MLVVGVWSFRVLGFRALGFPDFSILDLRGLGVGVERLAHG